MFFLPTKRNGSPLLDKRLNIWKIYLLAGNDRETIDIFSSEDSKNISRCIFRYLTVYTRSFVARSILKNLGLIFHNTDLTLGK
jgi:hypothetical protein